METEVLNDDDDNMQIFDEDDDDQEPGNPLEEAIEVPAPNEESSEAKIIKPKRVIKNPQPKLDAIRLMGPRGIGILQSTFKDVKFKGKGYERDDMKLLMKKLEHWAHRLYPKFPFDDTLKQIEKLGAKKPVQNMVNRIRLDMFQSDEFTDPDKENNNETSNDAVPEVDVFDELLSTGPFAKHNSDIATPHDKDSDLTLPSSQSLSQSLTDEQRERMERKRLEALEKRRKRLQEQQMSKEISLSQRMGNSSGFPSDDFSLDSVVENVTRIESSSENRDEMSKKLNEESSNVETSVIEENNTVQSSTENVSEINTNVVSNDVDMVTEDDLLSLIN